MELKHACYLQTGTFFLTLAQRLMSNWCFSIEESVVASVKKYLSEEVLQTMHEQQSDMSTQLMSALRSSAATPVSMAESSTQNPADKLVDRVSKQAQILQMLQAGQFDAAFKLALSASDLSLVVYACENASPAQIFQQPLQLQQSVLLCLIQQLSIDLENDTDLKQK